MLISNFIASSKQNRYYYKILRNITYRFFTSKPKGLYVFSLVDDYCKMGHSKWEQLLNYVYTAMSVCVMYVLIYMCKCYKLDTYQLIYITI